MSIPVYAADGIVGMADARYAKDFDLARRCAVATLRVAVVSVYAALDEQPSMDLQTLQAELSSLIAAGIALNQAVEQLAADIEAKI